MRHNLNVVLLTVFALAVLVLAAGPVNHAGLLIPAASAGGVTGATDDTETLYTASEDGKTIYMWQAYGSKPPKYLGKSDAIAEK